MQTVHEIAQHIEILIEAFKARGMRLTVEALKFSAFALTEDITRINRDEKTDSQT
jgi:CheY-like chemotaxis protein